MNDTSSTYDRIKRAGEVNLDQLHESLMTDKGLSMRECDIFFVVGSGVNNIEAGERLNVTEGTIKFHLTSIFKKLKINSRAKVVLLAHGLEPLC